MIGTNYVFLAVFAAFIGVASSFTSFKVESIRPRPSLQHKTKANLFWFSGKDDGDNSKKSKGGDSSSDMRNVGEVMDSMDNFKKSGKIAKMTDSLVQELSTISIEGSAADGKVKVFFDGQQRPMNVEIDDSYLGKVTADDLNAALTSAMQDAHQKSAQKMEEKMKPFFAELGLTQV